MASVSVVVFSDEPILIRGLQVDLNQTLAFDTAYVSDASAISSVIQERQAKILLLDLTPDIHIGVVRAIRKQAPDTYVVLWARSISAEIAHQAIEFGVRGIVQKTVATESMIECLRVVAEGEMWLDKSLAVALLTSKPVKLTPREGELVTLLAQGLKNKEIATALNIAEGTVKVYLSRLFEKVGAKDRFELALFGVRNLINVDPIRPGDPQRTEMSLRSMVMRRSA